jgi:hypothetical protein
MDTLSASIGERAGERCRRPDRAVKSAFIRSHPRLNSSPKKDGMATRNVEITKSGFRQDVQDLQDGTSLPPRLRVSASNLSKKVEDKINRISRIPETPPESLVPFQSRPSY